MTAIEITDHGVEVDPLGQVSVHPAAELFPLLGGEAFDALVEDIRQHGQREPIVLTPDGLLLDGRNRWRACAKAGITPVTTVDPGEPWALALSANLHRRHLSDGQRAMIGAKVAKRSPGKPAVTSSYDDIRPPSRADVAQMLNIGSTAIDRAVVVQREGTASLQALVEDGLAPVYTAARVATELDVEQQNAYAAKVRSGADAVRLASALDVPHRTNAERALRSNNSSRRHRHIGVPALQSLVDSLGALDMLLRSTDGLDPALNSDEAGRFAADLVKGLGAARRVQKLLKQRQETTS